MSCCMCDGTVKFTHFQCLKRWVRSKVQIRASDCSLTYHWRALSCDICKMETPLRIKAGGEVFSLMEFQQPETPYIVLETVEEEEAMRTRHVISFNEKHCVTLGRGLDSDVRINDISVSRAHALLLYDRGHFLIQDSGSKFGTSLLISQPTVLISAVTIQSGRSLLRFELEKGSIADGNGCVRVQDSFPRTSSSIYPTLRPVCSLPAPAYFFP